MRHLTIEATSRVTSVYAVEVADDFDTEDSDALLELVDTTLLLSQHVRNDARVIEDGDR